MFKSFYFSKSSLCQTIRLVPKPGSKSSGTLKSVTNRIIVLKEVLMAHKQYPHQLRKKIFDILNNNINALLKITKKTSLAMSQFLRIDP